MFEVYGLKFEVVKILKCTNNCKTEKLNKE